MKLKAKYTNPAWGTLDFCKQKLWPLPCGQLTNWIVQNQKIDLADGWDWDWDSEHETEKTKKAPLQKGLN